MKLQVSGPDPRGTPTDKVLCCCSRENPQDCSKRFGVKGKKDNTEGKYANRITCPLGFHRDTNKKYKKFHEGKNPCKGLPEPEPTAEPTTEPPTAEPTAEPTAGPTAEPTVEPTSKPKKLPNSRGWVSYLDTPDRGSAPTV